MTLDSVLEGILSEGDSEEIDENDHVKIKIESGSDTSHGSSLYSSLYTNISPHIFQHLTPYQQEDLFQENVASDISFPDSSDQLLVSIKSEVPDSCTAEEYKVTFQPDSRHTGGGKLLAGRSLGITEGRKLVQLCLVDSVAQYPSSNQSSSLSPSLSSPPSPDTQQCSSTTQTSSVQQGSVKDEEDGPKRCCLVCGDVASGFHYGVSSCEACKAFFKRTIQGNIDYTCPVANKCEINKRRRKACQACRYQKCVRVGMLKEGVRLDRVRGGRQKYRRFPMEDNQTSGQTSRKVSLEENKVLESLSQCEPDPLASMPDPSLPSSVRNLATLADIYDRELVATIGWAKQVPGFTDLSLNVQMKLLQTSWTEVLTLSLVYKSLPKLGKLNFATDFSLDEVEAANCGMLEFFEKCMIIVERLEQLGITREEFLILKALVLANSNSRVEDPSETSLLPLNETILTSLQDAVNFIRCGDANFHVHRLLLVLPSLRDADMALRTFWSRVRQVRSIFGLTFRH